MSSNTNLHTSSLWIRVSKLVESTLLLSFYLCLSLRKSGTTIATQKGWSEFPVTKTCAWKLQRLKTPSIFSGAIYSPCCSLNRFLMRSKIRKRPSGYTHATSPVLNHAPRVWSYSSFPGSLHSLFWSGALRYFLNTMPPRTATSPLITLCFTS